MAIHYVCGDLLEAKVDYICHQVNCQGKMNSGIAKSIREKWPVVYEDYLDWYNYYINVANRFHTFECGPTADELMLGTIRTTEINSNLSVISLGAQQYYGYDNRRYTSYDAFWNCLGLIKGTIPKGKSLGFPDHIGCCRGGANWKIICTMIEEALGNDYEVYIYKLED